MPPMIVLYFAQSVLKIIKTGGVSVIGFVGVSIPSRANPAKEPPYDSEHFAHPFLEICVYLAVFGNEWCLAKIFCLGDRKKITTPPLIQPFEHSFPGWLIELIWQSILR